LIIHTRPAHCNFTSPAFTGNGRPRALFSQAQSGYDNSSQSTARDKPRSLTHWFALACVWITFASSGLVFSEPAPVDALSIGLVLLLPVIGLVRISGVLVVYLALWLIIAAGHYLASANATDVSTAVTFSSVSLFLYIVSFVIAAFTAYRPKAHGALILSAWTFAALFATILALMSYVGMIPGGETLFMKFGRASGTFKDPNVFGAFLVAPIVYMVHLSIHNKTLKAFGPLFVAGLLSIGVLLCFSRGAWINLAAAVIIYGYLAFVTAPSNWQRSRIMIYLMAGVLLGITVIGVAVQFDSVSGLLSERASLLQSYDAGHEGRFGGQAKALTLITQNAFGIGPKVFGTRYHHEEVHNVYLSIVLNAGWIGGGLYWVAVFLTIGLGLRHALKGSGGHPIFLVLLAAFMANALEGVVIDSDHWRHFYVLMGMCWGFMSVAPYMAREQIKERAARTTLASMRAIAHRSPRMRRHA